MKFNFTLHLSATLLLILSAGIASADWSADFNPPSHDKAILSILLPNDIDSSTLTTLAVELDGIDVTALLTLEDQQLSFMPVEALSVGPHLLRLLVLQADGSSYEKKQWPFDVTPEMVTTKNASSQEEDKISAAESWLKSSSFKADTLTEFSNRAASRNLGNSPPDHTILSGSGNLQGNLQGEKLSIDMYSNYFLQSEKGLSLSGKRADIGEYRVAANYAGEALNTTVTLGHHDLGLNSMLISSFNRRGISAQVTSKNQQIAGNIFSFNPVSQVGSNHFTGLSDSNNRLEGASVSLKPFSTDANALKITGMYYDGERSANGIGASNADEVSTGSGWGVVLEKKLADGKINLQGQYAQSRYDIDGSSGLAPEDDSDAVSLSITARPFDNSTLFDKGIDIVLGAKYERIDTFFQSLANPGLPANHDTVNLYSDLYWGGLYTRLELSHETNNVDDLKNIPTDKLRNFIWNSSYSFSTQTGSRSWLGSPYIGFSGFISDFERQKTPTGYTGFDTDEMSKSFVVDLGSNYERFYWSARHDYSLFNDYANNFSDAVFNTSDISLNWRVLDATFINSSLQYIVVQDKDNRTTDYTRNLNIGVTSPLIKNKLNLNLNYNLNQSSGNTDSLDIHTINSELGWTIKPATTNSPGYSLAIRGSLASTNGETIKDETSYQIFAIFRITAAVATRR
ncbi:MAG: hypothetical protein COA63_009080 [Methylophaga sp.]|nr:hypothetical protein [Methylophaga sp.]